MSKEIILSKGDYVLLSSFIKNNAKSFSDINLKKLAGELHNAKVVDASMFPKNVVKLNSQVTLSEAENVKDITLKLVMPAEADIQNGKISIFAPLSAALIGYKIGDMVEWEMPIGTKRFKIIDVNNK